MSAICRPAQMKYLPEIREFVAAAGNRYDLSPDDIFALKLAADEVCTNIIEYGYPAGEPGLVSLTLLDILFQREPVAFRSLFKFKDDLTEAMTAFMQRRKPVFRGQ